MPKPWQKICRAQVPKTKNYFCFIFLRICRKVLGNHFYNHFSSFYLPFHTFAWLMQEGFKIINEDVSGNVDITVNTQINNLNADEVTVAENVTARLFGNIQKLLILKKDSKVFLHGHISGNIKNEGGDLTVFGAKK
jgi:hypothetical protein